MKKLLLVVGLVVLFFAQSSYSSEIISTRGSFSGVIWEKITSTDNEDTWVMATKPKTSETKSVSVYFFIRESNSIEQKDCFDFESKTYFNIDRCEEMYFGIGTYISKEPKNTNEIKKFVNLVTKDLCENPQVNYTTKIKKWKLFSGRENGGKFIVKCPKVSESIKLAANEKEKAMTKEKEQELLASVNAKRELCSSMDFQNGTDGMANCILQLMLAENKKNEQQQVIITSGNDGLADAMDEQTRILSKQLRIQKIQHSRENLKRFNHMMNTGTIPTW